MKIEAGGNRYNPEAQPNPYSQIPDLVRRSLSARPKDARRAERQLLDMITSDPYFDPTLIAIAEAQTILLTSNDARHISNTKKFLGTVVSQGAGGDTPRNELVFRLNTQIIDTVGRIDKNGRLIQKKNFLKRKLPASYTKIKDAVLGMQPDLQEELKHGTKEIAIIQIPSEKVSPETLTKLRQQLEMHNQWEDSVEDISMAETDIIQFNTVGRDNLIDLLKTEPEFSADVGIQKLYSKKYAGISLKDIEEMHYPLSQEEWSQVANYLIAAYTHTHSDRKLQAHAGAIIMLFFNITNSDKNIAYRNENMLANINSWQELFTYFLIFGQNQEVDTQIKTMVLSTPNHIKLSSLIFACCTNTIIMAPRYEEAKASQILEYHPLFNQALQYYLTYHSEQDASGLLYTAAEIGEEYFREVLLPQLKKRLNALGIDDRFDEEIKRLEQDIFSEQQLIFIKAVFEKNAGQEFLEKLQIYSQDVQEITKSVWQDALEKIHFLPMQEGENILEFSEESIPNTLGLKSISMTTVGSPQDWKIRAVFQPINIPFAVAAHLTQNGKLDFKAPIEQEMPGLYAMLNHIAVLTFHDLVVQEKKERERRTVVPNQEAKTQESQTLSLDGNVSDEDMQEDIQSKSSHPRGLPRVQSDRELIRYVYEATGRTPRKVELHKRPLQRIGDYQTAVDLYQEAITTGNISEDEINWIADQLNNARKKVYRISEQKRINVPAQFRLKTIQDPITKEDLYLETWVVEHSNPKPTPEELASHVRIYERYYKNSSALASLDQMKPWFVGQ